MSIQLVHDMDASTLAELRTVVAESEHMPGDALVRVRTHLGANSNGAKLKRVHIAEPKP